MALSNGPDATKANQIPASIPPLAAEEEDHIILARITNDERPLRRVIKKFHSYTSLAYPPIVPQVPGTATPISVDDARETFLVELASYQLSLKKSAMICDAETRQVEEYQREKERIEREHNTLRAQIEELKVALEHAQMLRRRKIEYDLVTEKVNSLPPRDELELYIATLENDMAAIRVEHEVQTRAIQSQKSSLDSIIVDLQSLRFIGKDKEAPTASNSTRATPIPESLDPSVAESSAEQLGRATPSVSSQAEKHPPKDSEEKEEGEEDREMESTTGKTEESLPKEDDIEMGEVEEEPRFKKKNIREEELEEGEASDFSSELSEPPDDD